MLYNQVINSYYKATKIDVEKRSDVQSAKRPSGTDFTYKLKEVEVEYGYEAEQSDELTIKVGDIIKNVTMSEGGWWEGELNGKKGMFPDNFVKVIKSQEKETKKDEGKKKDVQATKRQSVKDLANKIKSQVHEGGPPMIRKKEPAAKKKRAKCVYSYEPENDDELKLEVGDVLDVLKQEEEGWWEGILSGKQGMFPSNFVELIDESAESAENTENKIENTEEHLIKGKKIQGVGLGNIFGDGPIKLRSTGGKKPGDKPQEPPKAEKREDPVQRRLKGFRAVPEDTNTDDFLQVQADHARSLPRADNAQNIVEKHSSFCEDIDYTDSDYIDSDIAYLDNIDLHVLDIFDKKSDNLKAAVEEDLFEFEDVDINPDNFDCSDHEHIEIKPAYPDEDLDSSSSDSCKDIDCNNNRGPEVQVGSYQQNKAALTTVEKVDLEKRCAGDYSESLKTILDDLDNCLNDTGGESEDEVCNADVDPEKDAHDTNVLSGLAEGDRGSALLKKKTVTPKEYEKKLQSLNCWKNTSLTPPERLNFCRAIDSVLVTKKRLIDSSEKNPNQTPFHHHCIQEYGNMERAARALNYAAGDLGASGFMKFSVVTDEKGSTAVVAKPIEVHHRSCTSAFQDAPHTPKYQGQKIVDSKSPKTYFASLNRSGNLSPFIKSIADKYQLFGSEKKHFKQFEVADFQKEELDESYTINMLSHQPEDSCSVHPIKNEESLNDDGDLADPLVNQMVNNYVYDVITGENAVSELNGSSLDEVDVVTDLNGNRKLEDDISMAVCVDDNSVRIVNSKEDLGDSSVDKSDSSTLLSMTEGSEFPALVNITRSVYPYQSFMFKENVIKEILDVYPRESKIHAENDELLLPMQTEKHFLKRRNALTPKNFQRFKSHGSMPSKLPGSPVVRHSSSYCRIPFGTNAPTFWFSKDFTESPSKPAQINLTKLRSPKRTCSEINEPMPSLLDIAEQSHLEEFKAQIEAFKAEYPNLSTDKSPISLDHRSPAKKRRKKSSEQAITDYHCRHSVSALNKNWNALTQLPFEDDCNSVETFFTSRLDYSDEVCSIRKTVGTTDIVASPGNMDLQHYRNLQSDTSEDEDSQPNPCRERPVTFAPKIDHTKRNQFNINIGKENAFFFKEAESSVEKRKKSGFLARASSSDTKESPVKLLRYQRLREEFPPLEVYPLNSSENEKASKLLKKNTKKQFKERGDIFSCFDQYTKRTLQHQWQENKDKDKTKKTNEEEESNTILAGSGKESFTQDANATGISTVSSYFGCDNELEEKDGSKTSPLKVSRKVLLLASLGMLNFSEELDVEKAVDSHIKATDNVVEGDTDVTTMLESRNNLYSAISEAVQSCTEKVLENNINTPEEEQINNTDLVTRGREQDYSRNEDGCDVTPDVDALVSDLQGLDLSDTPQYVNNEADDNEMHAFLKEALGSLDDIMTESFTSTGSTIQDESKHFEDASAQWKEGIDDTVEIQNDSVLNVVGKKCIVHGSESVVCENISDDNEECVEISNDPVLTIVGKKCMIHKVNRSLEKLWNDLDGPSPPKVLKKEGKKKNTVYMRKRMSVNERNNLKDERLVDIDDNITEDSFDRSLINKATQSSPQEKDISTQTIVSSAVDTSVEIATQTETGDHIWEPVDDSNYSMKDNHSLTMDYDEAYDVDGNKIDDCKAAVALDSYFVYERQPTYFCTSSSVGYYHTESVLKNDDEDEEGNDYDDNSDYDDEEKPLCERSPLADIAVQDLSRQHIDYYCTESSLENPGINFNLEISPYLEEIENVSDDELNRTRGSSLDADLITEVNEFEKMLRDVDQKQGDQDESCDVEDIQARMQDSGKWLEEYMIASKASITEDEEDTIQHQESALSNNIPTQFEDKVSFYPSGEINGNLNMSASYDGSSINMP
ncbi:uncharacterized protein LOC123552352 isoform X2 [Mercenaria mercenaria]|uniref:uncharacterized protein LOC123552352 isoform X2 n=1 Tax=Mercenaria mercenaria TaxID=6596 RepID=UPI00234F7B1B|nr:uncharacterized protein LOC123552352 isoform X2 [Mercenaria mercenaria]